MIDRTVKRLVKARERLGISQREAAKRAGVSQSWASKFEAGKIIFPRQPSVRRYAKALGVPALNI